jgi:hypothetical protein
VVECLVSVYSQHVSRHGGGGGAFCVMEQSTLFYKVTDVERFVVRSKFLGKLYERNQSAYQFMIYKSRYDSFSKQTTNFLEKLSNSKRTFFLHKLRNKKCKGIN